MARIDLDFGKLLGFRLLDKDSVVAIRSGSDAADGRTGLKMGAKVGAKVGGKVIRPAKG